MQIKNIFFNRVKYTNNNVAYAKNTYEFMKENDLTVAYVNRGLVNQMAGMFEVPIWINLTEDRENKAIYCEIRSRDITVLEVAKKYGGGGHLTACGCTVNSWEEADKVIEDLDKLIEEK